MRSRLVIVSVKERETRDTRSNRCSWVDRVDRGTIAATSEAVGRFSRRRSAPGSITKFRSAVSDAWAAPAAAISSCAFR